MTDRPPRRRRRAHPARDARILVGGLSSATALGIVAVLAATAPAATVSTATTTADPTTADPTTAAPTTTSEEAPDDPTTSIGRRRSATTSPTITPTITPATTPATTTAPAAATPAKAKPRSTTPTTHSRGSH
jgi:hypothetical protein